MMTFFLFINITFAIGALCPFNRNKPHSPTKSQTTISVSFDPVTKRVPLESKPIDVIDVL